MASFLGIGRVFRAGCAVLLLAACGDDGGGSPSGSGSTNGNGGGSTTTSSGGAGGGTGAAGAAGGGCAAETCNGADDDCNGMVDDGADLCPTGEVCSGGRCRTQGAYVADTTYGSAEYDSVVGVGVQSDGTVVITGNFKGPIDFGGGVRTPVQYGSMFVVGLTPALDYVWDEVFGGTGSPSAWDLDIGADDRIAISGQTYGGAIDYGGGPSSGDGFALALEKDGAYRWDATFGNTGYGQSLSVSAGPDGSLVHAGDIQGTATFGPGINLTSAGYSDAYVARVDSAGTTLWAHGYGDGLVDIADSVDMASDGRVVINGNFEGTVDLGDGQPATSSDVADACVVAYDASGAYDWSVHFGAVGGAHGTGVAFCGDRIVSVGGFNDTVDILGESKTATMWDAYVLVLDAATGEKIFVKTFGSPGFEGADQVACSASGTIYVAGFFDATFDLGGGVRTSQGGHDVFLVALDQNGEYLWDKTWGGMEDDYLSSMTVAGDQILITGVFTGTIDLGSGPKTSTGENDGYLLVLKE